MHGHRASCFLPGLPPPVGARLSRLPMEWGCSAGEGQCCFPSYPLDLKKAMTLVCTKLIVSALAPLPPAGSGARGVCWDGGSSGLGLLASCSASGSRSALLGAQDDLASLNDTFRGVCTVLAFF